MNENFKNTCTAFVYLIRCGIREVAPKQEKLPNNLNYLDLLNLAHSQSLSAICCMALDSAGMLDEKYMSADLIKMWKDAKDKAIRKNILLDFKRNEIFDYMEEEKIWYMPLKGSILSQLYPNPGMRQMSDNDILFDSTYQKKIHDYMVSTGFECESYDKSHHDVYFMDPIYNYEFHTCLFSDTRSKIWYDYYINIKDKLILDEGKEYGYHFTDEDFYLYFLVHAYKHYSFFGTGFRTLLDTHVFLNHYMDTMDWDYIKREAFSLEIGDFERDLRHLAGKVFGLNADSNYMTEDELKEVNNDTISRKLNPDEKLMLFNLLVNGTYGTVVYKTKNMLHNLQTNDSPTGRFVAKIKYLKERLYPTSDGYRRLFPFFFKYKIFFPLMPVYRTALALYRNKHSVFAEFKEYFKY